MNHYKVILKIEIPVAANNAQEAQDLAFNQVQAPGLRNTTYALLDVAVYYENNTHTETDQLAI